jgi:hypothetical protein
MTDAVLEEQYTADVSLYPPKLGNLLRNGVRGKTGSRNRPKQSTGLRQALDLQRLAHKSAMALEKDLDSATSPDARKQVAVALRQAVAAWEAATERVRIAKNKPLPGSLRPESKPKAKVKSQTKSFVESAPAPVTAETLAAS